MEPGQTVTVQGLRGSFTVIAIKNREAVVYGGTQGKEKWRTFAMHKLRETGDKK